MRRYETVVIAQANLPEDDLTGLIDRYASIITDRKGAVVKVDRWGVRKLAYDIRKQSRGAYVLYDFAATSDVVAELERILKIDDHVVSLQGLIILTHVGQNLSLAQPGAGIFRVLLDGLIK